MCVCVHFSMCNFLMKKCWEAEGRRGEVRSDWLSFWYLKPVYLSSVDLSQLHREERVQISGQPSIM